MSDSTQGFGVQGGLGPSVSVSAGQIPFQIIVLGSVAAVMMVYSFIGEQCLAQKLSYQHLSFALSVLALTREKEREKERERPLMAFLQSVAIMPGSRSEFVTLRPIGLHFRSYTTQQFI